MHGKLRISGDFGPRGCALRGSAGLRVELSDCSEGTPFANMLWVGRKEGS